MKGLTRELQLVRVGRSSQKKEATALGMILLKQNYYFNLLQPFKQIKGVSMGHTNSISLDIPKLVRPFAKLWVRRDLIEMVWFSESEHAHCEIRATASAGAYAIPAGPGHAPRWPRSHPDRSSAPAESNRARAMRKSIKGNDKTGRRPAVGELEAGQRTSDDLHSKGH